MYLFIFYLFDMCTYVHINTSIQIFLSPGRQTENYFYLIYLLIRNNNLHNFKYSFYNVALNEDTSVIVSYLYDELVLILIIVRGKYNI